MIAKRSIRGWLTAGAAALALVACGGGGNDSEGFVPTALVTDVADMQQNAYSTINTHVDPNLVNPWGLVFNPQGFVWVANNGTSTSTLYDGNGVPQSLVVAIPPPGGGGEGSTDGHRLQCLAGLPGDRERGDRCERLHLRRRRRHDLRAGRRPSIATTPSWWSTARPRA